MTTANDYYTTNKHPFEGLPNSSVTCRWCERSVTDPLHTNVVVARTHDCIDAEGNATGLFCPACASERKIGPRSGQAGTCYRCFIDGYEAGKTGKWIANYAAGYATHDAPHTCQSSSSSPQPPSDSNGEWRMFEHYPKRVLDEGGCVVAEAQTEEQAAQIVSDHAAIPKLVDVLNLFLAMDNCNYELETMRRSGLFEQIHEALDFLGERGKRHQTVPSLSTTCKGG